MAETSFMVGHVHWGCVQHGMKYLEVCSLEINEAFSSQAMPLPTLSNFAESSSSKYRKLHAGFGCMTDCEVNSVRYVDLSSLARFALKFDCVRSCFDS
ncbi:hypothetical protein ACE6H2_000435 [Prunus campanulata]